MNSIRWASLCLAVLAANPLLAQDEESMRTWKDRSGAYSIEAAFEKLEGSEVSLRKPDGSTLVISLSKLSLADVVHIKELVAPLPEPGELSLGGTWGGKWDDEWEVFLIIDPKDGERIHVRYVWRENRDRPLQSKGYFAYRQPEGFFRASALHFRLNEDHMLLYGAFGNPRAARLVKVDADREDLEDIDLAAKGWIEGVMPASEAKIAVTSPQ
ncbi:MAG: SHD1 domain-containing protein [Verrucomicrobiota bacterium]